VKLAPPPAAIAQFVQSPFGILGLGEKTSDRLAPGETIVPTVEHRALLEKACDIFRTALLMENFYQT